MPKETYSNNIFKQIEKIVQNKDLWYVFDEKNGKDTFNLDGSVSQLTYHINEAIHPRKIRPREVRRTLERQFSSGLQFFVQVESDEDVRKIPFLLAVKFFLEQLTPFVPLVMVSKGDPSFQYLKAEKTETLGIVSNYWQTEKAKGSNIDFTWTMFVQDKAAALAEDIKDAKRQIPKPIKLIVVDDKKSELENLEKKLKEVPDVDLVTLQIRKDDKGETNHQAVFQEIQLAVKKALQEEKQPLLVLDLDNTLIDTDKALQKLAHNLACLVA